MNAMRLCPMTFVAAASVLAIGSCAHAPIRPVERVQTCPALSQPAALFRAGFGRADITTPPGPGLAGYGPEGRAARGWRQRIHARAMALEGADGERIVFATVDLDYAPGSLHRAVAERVLGCGGPDASRIVLSATHTHSAPGHFSQHRAYDEQASTVAGYDPAILELFAERTAHAILTALSSLAPARAAWGSTPVWGITRIRSFGPHMGEAHEMPYDSAFVPPADLPEPYRHADPTLRLLRVDTGSVRSAPAGAFSIFAMHGTGNSPYADLIDADVWSIPQRDLEWRIDSLNGAPARGFHARAVHVMANGAEGDAMPSSIDFAHRDSIGICDLPELQRPLRPGGYRSPPAFEAWLDAKHTDIAACIERTQAETDVIGRTLAAAALSLHAALADSLRNDVHISRAFENVVLRGASSDYSPPIDPIPGLCEQGVPGAAAAGGAESARTRIYGARVLFFPLGTESGGAAVRPSDDCQSPKRTVPKFLLKFIVGAHPVEEMAQFTVARIGPVLIGTVPFEATTTVGARIRAALRDAAGSTASGPTEFALLGIANGFLQYVTTASEYRFQHYEGGSTIYGPSSAEVYTGRLADLTRLLAGNGWASTPATVLDFPTFPGPPVEIMPRRHDPPANLSRVIEDAHCRDGRAWVRWIDARPGALFPADGQVISVVEERGGAWVSVAWDDHTDVEVRVVHDTGAGRSLWEAGWRRPPAAGRFRFVLSARPGLPELASEVLRCE